MILRVEERQNSLPKSQKKEEEKAQVKNRIKRPKVSQNKELHLGLKKLHKKLKI